MELTLEVDPTLTPPNGPAQTNFLLNWADPYVAFVSGWGGGKTWAGARKLRDQHCVNAFDEDGYLTCVKSLGVEPTFTLCDTVMIPAIGAALDEAGIRWTFIRDPKVYAFFLPDLSRGSWAPATHRLGDLSLIFIRSANNADTIAGFEVGAIWGDESARWPTSSDPTSNPFIQVPGRLRDVQAKVRQINYTFTHEGDVTQVFKDFVSDPKPGHTIYVGETRDNEKNLGPGYIEGLEATLSPELALQYLKGQAASLRGNAIYYAFDDARNLLPVDAVPLTDRPLHLSVDFNHTPGMHATIGQRADNTPDLIPDVLHAYAEVEHEDGTLTRRIPDMVDAFAAWVHRTGGWRWPELWVFADATKATDAQRGETTHDVLFECLRRYGWPLHWCIDTHNPFISDRVHCMNGAMRDAGGRVHYRVHPSCKRLLKDFREMKWAGDKVSKDDKLLSHQSDGEGYRVWYLRPFKKPGTETHLSTSPVVFGGR